MAVPHSVACAAPGAVTPNRSRPSGSRVAELELITGASTMLKVASLMSDRAELVVLLIAME